MNCFQRNLRSCCTAWLLLAGGNMVLAQEADVVAAQVSEPWTTRVTVEGAELKLVTGDCKFTEGPAADRDGRVYFTDQPNDRILRWTEGEELEQWLSPAGRSNGLYFDRSGALIACADGNNELWRIDVTDKSHRVLLDGFDGELLNGPNDVWVANDTTFYFTDPFYKRNYWTRAGGPQLPQRVYRWDAPSQKATIAASDFEQPNGIVGDADRRVLFVADIKAGRTFQFRIADDGTLVDRKLFCEMGSDGMTLDEAGNLYLTGKAGVSVFNSQGKKIETIAVPKGWTANVCFGGSDRQTLFITASDSAYTIRMLARGLSR